MADLIVSLIPLALGVLLSPLAIMALVAVLLSRRARINGVTYLIGWAFAIAIVLALAYLILGLFEVHDMRAPPVWVPIVRIALGLLLLGGAVYVYRRGHRQIAAMSTATTPADVVRAAPQLPGWLRAVEHFTPLRSGLLGLGIFILNPVDASCAILAALEVRQAAVDPATGITTLIVFGVVGVLPIAVPVILTLARGTAAEPALTAMRNWIASHTGVLNAALLLVIAVLQLQKGVTTLVGY